MKNKINLIILLVFCLSSSFICPELSEGRVSDGIYRGRSLSHHFADNVLIGYRTGESTAQLVITKAGIEQNIMGTTPDLTGLVVLNGSISLKVNKVTSYLIFQSNNAANEKVTIALELVSDSNNLVYKQKSGRQIFICKSTGSCNTCEFIFDNVWIMGCRCSSVNSNDSSGAANCQLKGIISK